jgi:hypothetical protein
MTRLPSVSHVHFRCPEPSGRINEVVEIMLVQGEEGEDGDGSMASYLSFFRVL